MTDRECTVYELRQYTVRPERRDALMAVFDSEFVAGQETTGIRVLGQFRDTERADRFVWVRGFPDMDARRDSLTAFYAGPVWTKHQDAMLPDIIDTSDVLLLAPATPELDFTPDPGTAGTIVATTWSFRSRVADSDVALFADTVVPAMRAAGTPPLAVLRSAYHENTFPALPIRTDAHAIVTFASPPADRPPAPDLLGDRLAGQPEQLRLAPTPRSWLR